MRLVYYISFALLLSQFSCSDDPTVNPSGNPDDARDSITADWLIPVDEVFDGGPGKDGIPSIDSPNFSDISDIDFMDDNDLVIGIVHNGEVRAYPHPVLDWHEIVNDEIGDMKVALTYCPLTGTGIAWNRVVDGRETTFGVSGKLYNSNLMPYDRASDSYWSQLRLESVYGDIIGTRAETIPIIETSWSTWKEMYPDSKVLNSETGFTRNYMRYPYGDYRTNHSNIIFPLNPSDNRLPSKERLLGVITDDASKAYSINLFNQDRLIIDEVNGIEYMIAGSKGDNYIVAYSTVGLGELTFVANDPFVIAQDNNGNRIAIDGRIIDGPLSGTQLTAPNAFMGYWMAFGAFYSGIDLYED